MIVDGKQSRLKPDYRSESLKLVVEFDGTHHYKYPDTIDGDIKKTKIYEQHGYTVVRIPFFIQLTKEAVKKLFNVDLDCELFDGSIPSLGVKGRNSPACLCSEGVKRMAREFKKFPEQYIVNLNALKQQGEPLKTGVETLEDYYNSIP